MVVKGLPPVVDRRSKVLVLGSFPGRVSLAKKQYYANPRNHFWLVLCRITGQPLTLNYEERVAGLLASGVALWDVLASCERAGSKDTSIRNPVPNDFARLFEQYPGIRMVAFNGAKAYELWRRLAKHQIPFGVHEVVLPSTSPVLAKPLGEKIAEWEVIREYLREAKQAGEGSGQRGPLH